MHYLTELATNLVAWHVTKIFPNANDTNTTFVSGKKIATDCKCVPKHSKKTVEFLGLYSLYSLHIASQEALEHFEAKEKILILYYSTLLYSALLYSTLPYSILRYCMLLYATLRYGTLLYSTLHYGTLLYSTLLYATLVYATLL